MTTYFVRIESDDDPLYMLEPLIFGRVEPWETIEAQSDDPADLAQERRLYAQGLPWCRCYSIRVPDGEGGHVARDVRFAITADEFEHYRAQGWRCSDGEAEDFLARATRAGHGK